jgi:hypothetical protein
VRKKNPRQLGEWGRGAWGSHWRGTGEASGMCPSGQKKVSVVQLRKSNYKLVMSKGCDKDARIVV